MQEQTAASAQLQTWLLSSYINRVDRFNPIVWIAGAALGLACCDAAPPHSQKNKQLGSDLSKSVPLEDPRSGLVIENGPIWPAGAAEPRGSNDFTSRKQWRAWAGPAWIKACHDVSVKNLVGFVPRQGRVYRRRFGIGEEPQDLLAGKGVLLADGLKIPVVWVWTGWPVQKGDPLPDKRRQFTITRSSGVALWLISPHPALHDSPEWGDPVVSICNNLRAHLDS